MPNRETKQNADKLLSEYCKEYKTVLFKYAYIRTGNNRDAAEDCVQEAYLIIYKRMLKGENFKEPKAFLYRTVDNFVKEYLRDFSRKQKTQISLDSDEANALYSTDSYFDSSSGLDEEEITASVLGSLSDSDKILYRSRYVEKLSVKEISDKFGISVSAVTTRLLRLRSKISEKLNSELKERGISNE